MCPTAFCRLRCVLTPSWVLRSVLSSHAYLDRCTDSQKAWAAFLSSRACADRCVDSQKGGPGPKPCVFMPDCVASFGLLGWGHV